MKILKPNSIQEQSSRYDILSKYKLVKDNETIADTVNVTTYDTLKLFLEVSRIDYITFRNSLKTQILPSWGTLSEIEKKNLITEMVYPPTETLENFFPVSELKTFWASMARKHKEARVARWDSAREILSYYITTEQAFYFYNDTKQFKDDYIDANIPKLYLWTIGGTDSTIGIDYTTTGLQSKSYYTENLKNILINCLIGDL